MEANDRRNEKMLSDWMVAMDKDLEKVEKKQRFIERLLLIDTGIITLLVLVIAFF